MSSDKPPKEIGDCIAQLLEQEWKFLDEPWPLYPKTKKYHRSEFKPIRDL
jgi:hypothetical protein